MNSDTTTVGTGRDLTGRTAFVSGGASGIGRIIARRLAEAGADVVITSRDAARMGATLDEIAASGVAAHGVALDLADPASADRAFAEALSLTGGIDVVVANSGIGGPTAPLWELEVADLEETLDVNVRGTFLLLRAATRHMVPRGRGSIVVIGSMTGKRPLLNRTPYAASKMALVGLVRTLAAEAGPHGVRVNLVSPGFVSGPRLDWVVAGQASARSVTEDEMRAEMTADTPLRRFTAPEDVADTVVHLAGDRSAGITGADINVSAGLVMY